MAVHFVTGGNGFIGSHLIESLTADGHRVRALVRDPDRLRWLPRDGVELVTGDLDDADVLRRGVCGVDAVVHAAALTRAPSDRVMFEVNLEGTRRVLDACLAQPTPPRLLFVSSQAAGGPSPDGEPVTESSEPSPRSGYGRSKLAAERLLLAEARRLPVTILRAPSVYGPRDSGFAFLFRVAARGFMPYPAGLKRLSLVHVDDVVRGMRMMLERGRGTYYLTDGSPHELPEVLGTIARAVGGRVLRVGLPPWLYLGGVWVWERLARLRGGLPPMTFDRARETLSTEWICSDARAREELGYRETWPVDEGMSMTAEWYRSVGWLPPAR